MLPLVALASLAALGVQASVIPVKEVTKRNDDGTDCSTGTWTWKDTNTVFSFGDSYTYESFNTTTFESGGTAANGPNWIQDLTTVYNVSSPIFRWNVAYAGAMIDNDVITPYTPTVKSIKDQVEQFEAYVQSGATWEQEKALCSMWIGINDIGNSYTWTNVSFSDFYQSEIDELKTLVTKIQSYSACAAWMFLSVPPLGATPLHAPNASQISPIVEMWNDKLETMAMDLGNEWNETWVGVFDTGKVFTALIENGDALGFTNVTGYNELYPIQYGVKQPGNNSQIEPYLPMSSYLWQDTLHPTWPVHNFLAHAVATFLGAVNVVKQ